MSEARIEIKRAMNALTPTTISIAGAITILSIETLLTELTAAFNTARNIELNLSGVTELDLAGMQLLCAAHRSSYANCIEFKVTGHNPYLWEMAEASGHIRLKGCELDTNNTCVWNKESNQL